MSTNRNAFPVPVVPMGACMVAEAVQKGGHSVRFLDLMFSKKPDVDIGKAIMGFRPDAIGISIRNIDNNDFSNTCFFLADLPPLIRAIRATTDAPLIIGGAAVSVMTEEILRFTGASWAVVGDGEHTMLQLLDVISSGGDPGTVRGIAWLEDGEIRINPPRTLSSGPYRYSLPDFGKWLSLSSYTSRLAQMPLQTKLGCSFRCIYCTYRKIEGNRYRLCEPEMVVGMMKQLSERGLKDIEFVDNIFNYPRLHALEICDAVCRAGLKLRLQSLEMNPGAIDDELLRLLERAGFIGIGVTAESVSDRVLRGLRKGFTSDDVYRAALTIQKSNIPCAWIFMFGGPGETESTVKETLRFAKSFLRKKDIAFFGAGIRIYPGTELERIARKEGILSVPARDMLRPVFYVSPGIDYNWIKQEINKAADGNMNFIHTDSLSLPFLPGLHRLAGIAGVSPPLWKHTRLIRRTLRLAGINA
jgi:radical SAM superfamily enzyme YgiQ (UPF0313 family)